MLTFPEAFPTTIGHKEPGQGFLSGSPLRAVGKLWLFLINGKDSCGTPFPSSSCLAQKCVGRSYSNYTATMRKKLFKAFSATAHLQILCYLRKLISYLFRPYSKGKGI